VVSFDGSFFFSHNWKNFYFSFSRSLRLTSKNRGKTNKKQKKLKYFFFNSSLVFFSLRKEKEKNEREKNNFSDLNLNGISSHTIKHTHNTEGSCIIVQCIIIMSFFLMLTSKTTSTKKLDCTVFKVKR